MCGRVVDQRLRDAAHRSTLWQSTRARFTDEDVSDAPLVLFGMWWSLSRGLRHRARDGRRVAAERRK